MSHSVRRHLRLEVGAYDATIRRFIPGYEEMLSVAAQAVAAVQPKRVLDLGAGTGSLTEALLDRTEDGMVELWDVDLEMLAQATARLERFGERANPVVRSFFDPFPPCDAIMASLSLHHIPTLGVKAEVFRRAFEAIRPGGVFVNADATMPAAGPERDATWRAWADHMVANGIEESRAWEHFEDWAEEDTYFPLEDELAALVEAGFDPRCEWREAATTVVVAGRP